MLNLTDSRRAAYEDRVSDNNTVLLRNSVQPYNRRPQKKMFYIIILIPIIILIGFAIAIVILYNQTSSLSQQLAALQTENTVLQSRIATLQNSFIGNLVVQLENSFASTQCEIQTFNQSSTSFNTRMSQLGISVSNAQSEFQTLNQSAMITMGQLESSLSTTQLEISSLNQSFVSFGQDVAVNITQVGNSISGLQSEVQAFNQNFSAAEAYLNASITKLETLYNPLFLNYTNNGSVPVTLVCGGAFVSVPKIELTITSQNGGYGICEFSTTYSVDVWIDSSLTLDGSFIASINPYPSKDGWNHTYGLILWSQNFQFSAGNHNLGVMAAIVTHDEYPCTTGTSSSVDLESGMLSCTFYGAQAN